MGHRCVGFSRPTLTLDAATSCAVLAAISCEHTISSSNFPLPCTTRSAASLHKPQQSTNSLRRDARLTEKCYSGGGSDAYTITVAPQPTALDAEIRPSVQREFLA